MDEKLKDKFIKIITDRIIELENKVWILEDRLNTLEWTRHEDMVKEFEKQNIYNV